MDLAFPIERHAAFAPKKAAIRFADEDLDYATLAARIRHACGKLAALDVGEGDVVAFLGFNHPEMLALLFACARLRAILLPLNWRLTAAEHARVIADAKPRLVLVTPDFLGHAQALRGGLPTTQWLALASAPAGWRDWMGVAPGSAAKPAVAPAHEAPVLLCYTSGSTGAPKGVALTQGALFFNVVNSVHMHDLTSADRVLTTLPMFHVGGLNIQTVPALHAGATVILHAKFDPDAAFDAIERERVTLAVLVPAQLTAMMKLARWSKADLSSLRVLTTGSTIVSQAFVQRVHERGVPLIQVYGTTETCPIAAYLRIEDARRKAGAAGLPALYCALRIVDENDNDVPAGADGEILVRGPNVMQGYWNAPAATATALRGGWYHSGDIGHVDVEGYLHVVGAQVRPDHFRRREHLPRGDRERPARTSGDRRGLRGRLPGRALGRGSGGGGGAQARRTPERRRCDRDAGRPHRPLQAAPRGAFRGQPATNRTRQSATRGIARGGGRVNPASVKDE